MTAFDTDVLSDVFRNIPAAVARAATIPPADQVLPVVTVEEVLRGRLDAIRKAQAGVRGSPVVAYQRFVQSLRDLGRFQWLEYSPAADTLFHTWRAAGIRIGSQDLRTAAICVSLDITLATRNARDFRQVPGLKLDIWP